MAGVNHQTAPSASRLPEARLLAFQSRQTWITHGLWVAALGFTATSIYGFAHGQSLYGERYPLCTALVSYLCLLIVRTSPQAAAVMVLFTVWLDLIITVLNVGAFVDGSMIVFPVLVFASGLLLGAPGATVTAAASVVGAAAAGFLGGATLERLGRDHGREGFFLFAMSVCSIGTAVMSRAALRSFTAVLARSERDRVRYMGLVEQLPDGLLGLDAAGRIIESNDAAARMLGLDKAGLVGRDFRDVARSFGSNSPFEITHTLAHRPTIEITVSGPEGAPTYLELTAKAVDVPEAPTLVLLRDITHRKLIEHHLGHAQRLEAVGQLAGGIAHDFNNLLTAIGGSAEMITMSGDPESRESAQVILSAQKRGTNLTRQLLAFARRDIHKAGTIDLAKTVAGMSLLAERLLGSEHRLNIAASAPVLIEADPAQVEQVVLNLVSNARDAMPKGGEVRISVRAVNSEEAHRLGSRLVESRQALLEIADTGTGIEPELRSRIFEPFFTTKQRGRGTGLGLAAVQGIVVQNKGSLALESEVGVGSRFRIFFAVADASAGGSGGAEAAPALAPAKREQGRLLIVDDEDGVRLTAKRLLEKQGYQVYAAAGGAEALDLLAKHGPMDLVIADLAMPEMDGRELGERIQKHHPGVPVMYMSGYFNDPGLSQPAALKAADYLAKPFSREQLFETVKSAMAKDA